VHRLTHDPGHWPLNFSLPRLRAARDPAFGNVLIGCVHLVHADHGDGTSGANTGRTRMITTAALSGEPCQHCNPPVTLRNVPKDIRRHVVVIVDVKQFDKAGGLSCAGPVSHDLPVT
jgi:hypothetical protein